MIEKEKEEEEGRLMFERLPVELQRYIFQLLHGQDLWSCLYVCQHWRALANDNILWERHCIEEGLDLSENNKEIMSMSPSSKQALSSLCRCAVLWMYWIHGPVTKWKLKKSKNLVRERFSVYACFASYRNTLAVYKSEKRLIMLYMKKSIKVIPLPPSFYKMGSLFMNEKYIVGSCREGFLVYEKQTDGSYKLHLIFGIADSELMKFNKMEEWMGEYFWSLELVGIYGDDILIVTALGANFFYIVDLQTGKWDKIFTMVNVEESVDSEKYFVLRGGTCASVYSSNGEHIVSTSHAGESDSIEVCINNTTFAVFWTNGWETFALPSGHKLKTSDSSILPYHCLLPDSGEMMFVILHEENCCERLAAISLITGRIIWSKSIKKALNMKIVCNRYIHVSTSGLNWYLLDTYSGFRIYTGFGVVEHISDYYSVISDTGDITCISYYGKLHDFNHKRKSLQEMCVIN